jgi:hypothetical protein
MNNPEKAKVYFSQAIAHGFDNPTIEAQLKTSQ